MINWVALGINALWILGLGLALAGLGFAWQTRASEESRLGNHHARRAVWAVICAGLLLFCMAWSALAELLWMQIAWGALAIGFAYLAWRNRT